MYLSIMHLVLEGSAHHQAVNLDGFSLTEPVASVEATSRHTDKPQTEATVNQETLPQTVKYANGVQREVKENGKNKRSKAEPSEKLAGGKRVT